MPLGKIHIAGPGNIGGTLGTRLHERGVATSFYTRKDYEGGRDFGNSLDEEKPDAVALTIRNIGKGEVAEEMVRQCVDRKIPIALAEKFCAAHRPGILLTNPHLVGLSAVAGGGARFIPRLQSLGLHRRPRTAVHMILNATTNLDRTLKREGHTPRERYARLRKEGCIETGAMQSLADIYKVEGYDVLAKISGIVNTVLPPGKEPVKPSDIGPFEISGRELDVLERDDRDYRIVVSIFNYTEGQLSSKDYPFFGQSFGFHCHGHWNIVGGLRRIPENRPDWIVDGLNNVAYVTVDGQEILDANGDRITGIGAGPIPTTDALIHDLDALCAHKTV